MPNIRDHDASVYLKLQGDALHIGGYEHNPILIEGVSKKYLSFSYPYLHYNKTYRAYSQHKLTIFTLRGSPKILLSAYMN